MKQLSVVLMGLALVFTVQAKGPGKSNGKGKALGHAKQAAKHAFRDHEHKALAAFVLHKVHVEGLQGETLAKAVHVKMTELNVALLAGKALPIPVIELKSAQIHGGSDLKGLGAFVATKHAEGLKGIDLGKAVKTEAHRRHQARKEIKAQTKKQKGFKGKDKGKGKGKK